MKIRQLLKLIAFVPALCTAALAQGTFNNITVANNATFQSLNGIVVANGTMPAQAKTVTQVGGLAASNNLSDVANVGTSRSNLGLGTAATQNSSAFDAAGAAAAAQANAETYADNNKLAKSANLSDVANPATSRGNLGLGSSATHAASDFLAVANNLSDINNPAVAANNLGLGSSSTPTFLSVTTGSLGIVDGGKLVLNPVLYAGGGTQAMRFDLGAYGYVNLVADNTFTSTVTNTTGSVQIIDFINNGSSARNLNWPSGIVWAAGGAPSQVGPVSALRVELVSTGSTINSITGAIIGPDAPYLEPQTLVVGANGILNNGRLILTPVAYAAGGTQSIRMDIGAYGAIPLSADLNFNSAGGVTPGAMQVLDITNPSGSTRALAWPSGFNWGPSAIPTSIPNGGYIRVWLMASGNTNSSVFAFYTSGGGGGGGGVSQIVAGSNITVSPPGGTGTVTISATSGGGDVFQFNVKDYGAVGNGSTDDTTSIQNAVTAAAAFPYSTVIFPTGQYVISSAITLPGGYTGRMSFVGFGQYGAALICNGNGITMFNMDLTGGTTANNAVEFRNLTFQAAAGITGQACVAATYGHIASDSLPGVVIDQVTVVEGAGNGFVDGFEITNGWTSRISNIYAYGNGGSYDSGSGAASGTFIKFTGQCVNNMLSNIQWIFWQRGISFTCSGSDTVQGINMTNLLCVQSPQAIYFNGVSGCGQVNITNVLFDNGNIPSQSKGTAIYDNFFNTLQVENFAAYCNCTGGPQPFIISNSQQHQFQGVYIVAPTGFSMFTLSSVTQSQFCNNLTIGSASFATLDSGCNHNALHNNMDSSAGFIHSTDNGTNNSIGDPHGFTSVFTLSGGSPTETHYINIDECSLAGKPSGAIAQVTSNQNIGCQYNFDDSGNTESQIAVEFFNYTGGNLGSGPVRVTAVVNPN